MAEGIFQETTLSIRGNTIAVAKTGNIDAPAILFLHGWPQSWQAWQSVMGLASQNFRAVAIDLPGIGGSTWPDADGSKRAIADIVHQVIQQLELKHVTLVGHDVGGQVTYAYLTQHENSIDQAVIIDVAIPGLAPWEEVLRNPYIWHFAFHAVPRLPEQLVQGKQADYFNYFYDTIAANSSAITPKNRQAYVAAYRRDDSLSAGFEWYRAFAQDTKDNQSFIQNGGTIHTPLLYIRGEKTHADINVYQAGFIDGGVTNIATEVIANSGHFVAEEQPRALWESIQRFIQHAEAQQPIDERTDKSTRQL
ncbi:MAG TPA: alpha/beta hydrolase [Candidatus Saccharimonadales bacterium]|nr:alpha/beta hydrolase [Candidatus Saccharimonadales bacterium]